MKYWPLALGVFVGNTLIYGISEGDWQKGLSIGAIAAVLVLAFDLVRGLVS
jgi:hypothetical protein